MANNEHHFEQTIMTACTDIFEQNALHVFLDHICIHYFKRASRAIKVYQLMKDGLAKLNRDGPNLSFMDCIIRIEKAIVDRYQPEIVKSIVLNAYKIVDGPPASIFLLEKIDKYAIELCQERLSEVHSIITTAFEKVNPGDDSFVISSGQPEDLNKYYKDEIRSCVKCLLGIARFKVCLKIIIYCFMIPALH
jgi:hypothetical protein